MACFYVGLLKMTQNTKLYSAAQTPQDILSNILNIMGNIMISMISMNYSEQKIKKGMNMLN